MGNQITCDKGSQITYTRIEKLTNTNAKFHANVQYNFRNNRLQQQTHLLPASEILPPRPAMTVTRQFEIY